MTRDLLSAAVVDTDRADWSTVVGRIGRGFGRKIRRGDIRGLRRRRREGLDMVVKGFLVGVLFNG